MACSIQLLVQEAAGSRHSRLLAELQSMALRLVDSPPHSELVRTVLCRNYSAILVQLAQVLSAASSVILFRVSSRVQKRPAA